MRMWHILLDEAELRKLGGKNKLASKITYLTYDTALPQEWLNAKSDNEAEYRTLLEGVVWAYDGAWSAFGRPLALTVQAYTLLSSKEVIPGASDGSDQGRVV
jgi:hypothetical protein